MVCDGEGDVLDCRQKSTHKEEGPIGVEQVRGSPKRDIRLPTKLNDYVMGA